MTEYITEWYWDERRNAPNQDQREEIVRCRNYMKWHHIDTLDGVRYGECDEWKRADSYCVPATRESGFCAWGEKASNFTTCKCGEEIELGNREPAVCPSCGRTVIE